MFQFRLTPILKIRENLRRERQTELSKALEAEAILRERMKIVQNEIAHSKTEARNRMTQGTVNVDYMIGMRRREAFLLSQQSFLEEKLKIVLEEVEKRRLLVLEADKEVRVMEKLKDLQKERHDKTERDKETVQMDEIAGHTVAGMGKSLRLQ